MYNKDLSSFLTLRQEQWVADFEEATDVEVSADSLCDLRMGSITWDELMRRETGEWLQSIVEDITTVSGLWDKQDEIRKGKAKKVVETVKVRAEIESLLSSYEDEPLEGRIHEEAAITLADRILNILADHGLLPEEK
jgi:hypothetical protein